MHCSQQGWHHSMLMIVSGLGGMTYSGFWLTLIAVSLKIHTVRCQALSISFSGRL